MKELIIIDYPGDIYSCCRYFAFPRKALAYMSTLPYIRFPRQSCCDWRVLHARAQDEMESSTSFCVRVHTSCLDTAFEFRWISLTEILVRTYEIRATAVKHVRIFVLWNLFSKYSGVVYT